MSRELNSHCIKCDRELNELATKLEFDCCPFCGHDLTRQITSSKLNGDDECGDEHSDENLHLDSETQDVVDGGDAPIGIIRDHDLTVDEFLLGSDSDFDPEGYDDFEEEDENYEDETIDDGEVDEGDRMRNYKISQYATDLSHRTTSACTKSAIKSVYQAYHDILSDLPYYQSYNAIGSLLDGGYHFDHIKDVHALRTTWSENELLWGAHGNKHSLSWKLASDLLDKFDLYEVEIRMLNEWYDEWISTTRWRRSTEIGWRPGFYSYTQFLSHKCALIENTRIGW